MLALAIVLLVTLQRLGELAWSGANAGRLGRAGGIETGQGHYRALILVHVAWLAALWLAAASSLQSGHGLPVDPAWLCVYMILQVARAWVLWTLGRRWTTRVIVLPGAPLVRTGPYRFLRHPNYAVLAAEVAVLPLVFGLWGVALVFSVLNGLMLAVRIRAEERALCATQSGKASISSGA